MPSTTPELCAIIRARFGDIDPWPVEQFLVSRGFSIEGEGYIRYPVRPGATEIEDDEAEAVQFLIEEWDYWYAN